MCVKFVLTVASHPRGGQTDHSLRISRLESQMESNFLVWTEASDGSLASMDDVVEHISSTAHRLFRIEEQEGDMIWIVLYVYVFVFV